MAIFNSYVSLPEGKTKQTTTRSGDALGNTLPPETVEAGSCSLRRNRQKYIIIMKDHRLDIQIIQCLEQRLVEYIYIQTSEFLRILQNIVIGHITYHIVRFDGAEFLRIPQNSSLRPLRSRRRRHCPPSVLWSNFARGKRAQLKRPMATSKKMSKAFLVHEVVC